MHIKRQAFTVIELVFVIVIIGILSAIAVPKFSTTMDQAYTAKASSTLASVMTAIGIERQKRILKGDFTEITDLGDTTYAFNLFSADGEGIQNRVVETPIENCGTGDVGCWTRNGSAKTYVYSFADGSGTADFKLDNNRLVCDSDTADCAKLLKQ